MSTERDARAVFDPAFVCRVDGSYACGVDFPGACKCRAEGTPPQPRVPVSGREKAREMFDAIVDEYADDLRHLAAGAAPPPAEQEQGAPQERGAGGITNPHDVPKAQAVIHWLCELQARVAEHLGSDDPADCFCGESGFWPLKRAEDYRNAGKAVAFIEAATLKALSAQPDASPGCAPAAGSLSDTRTGDDAALVQEQLEAGDRLSYVWEGSEYDSAPWGAAYAALARLVAGAANTERDEARAALIGVMPLDLMARVDAWLLSNQKARSDVRHQLFPLGMVQGWIARAESAEAERDESVAGRDAAVAALMWIETHAAVAKASWAQEALVAIEDRARAALVAAGVSDTGSET